MAASNLKTVNKEIRYMDLSVGWKTNALKYVYSEYSPKIRNKVRILRITKAISQMVFCETTLEDSKDYWYTSSHNFSKEAIKNLKTELKTFGNL